MSKMEFDVNKFDEKVDLEYIKNHGRVEKISDSIVFCSGIEFARLHEIVLIDNTYHGVVLNLSEGLAGIGLLEETNSINEGMEVIATKQLFSLNASKEQLGTVINALGERIDGGKAIKESQSVTAFNIAPAIMKIRDVDTPLMTGQLIIDTLTPVGRGQRQLILGSRKTGKTQIAIETILAQKNQNIRCIYVAIGQKMVNISNTFQTLKKQGAMNYTTIVAASASSSLTMQYLVPYAAMGIAEHWRDKGENVLIIFDDLTKHADAYRAITLLLKRPPGREAYPGDIFYIHSSLLERAAQFKTTQGGGSITALPIVELLSDDLTAYIPTNIISITDGQLFLRTDLFNNGQKPAITIGESVSRVGSKAQYPIMRKMSNNIMLILSQYFELKEFMTFDNNLTEENLLIVHKGEILLELFRQDIISGYTLTQATILLYAFQADYFLDVPVQQIYTLKNIIAEKISLDENYEALTQTLLTAHELLGNVQTYFDAFLSAVKEEFVCQEQ